MQREDLRVRGTWLSSSDPLPFLTNTSFTINNPRITLRNERVIPIFLDS
jgi:hypothetical protein